MKKRLVGAAVGLAMLGGAGVGVAAADHEGASVAKYGTCVKVGNVDPADGLRGPLTIVRSSDGTPLAVIVPAEGQWTEGWVGCSQH